MLCERETSHIVFPLQVVKKSKVISKRLPIDQTFLYACARTTYAPARARNISWENEPIGQHALNSSTDEKNPTLFVGYMTRTKK